MFKVDNTVNKFLWLSKVSISNKPAKRSNFKSDISLNSWRASKRHENPEDDKYRYGFTIRNEAIKALGTNVDIAIFRNRVLFRVCKESEGYRLYRPKNAKCPNMYFTVSKNSVSAELEDFIGDYELKYDPFYELYYIEKEEDNDKK